MKDIERPIGVIMDGLLAIKNSKLFPDFLAIVLRIGNILNGGSPRGGAYGFKFEFLDKVRDIRTQKPNYLLTNFLASQFPVMELYQELEAIKKIPTVDLETAKKAFNALEAAFKQLSNKMPEAEKLVVATPPSNLFPAFIKFKEEAQPRIAGPGDKFKTIETEYQALVRAWGEDPDQTALLDFVNVYINLIEALKKAHEVNEKKKADEAKAAAKAASPAAGAARPAGGPRIAGGGGADAQRGVLDDLKKSLAAGPPALRRLGAPRP
jgi:hypothetical protein